MRKELLQLARACGVEHPSQVGLDRFEILNDELSAKAAREHFGYGRPVP